MSTLVQNIAAVSQTRHMSYDDVRQICAAVEKQLTQHYYPVWYRTSHIVAVKDEKSIPKGYWPAYIKDDIGEPGAAGFHTDKNNQPVIYVQYDGDATAITLSHEALEAATDPFGNRLIVAELPGIGLCHVLCEIADPPEAQSYKIDGIPVSDFITPEWYDRDTKPGVKYSYLGKINKPCTIIKGGYVSFINPQGKWAQQTWFSGTKPKIRVLGRAEDREPDESLREWIDRVTANHRAR